MIRDNIIRANLWRGNQCRTAPVWQWDYGQILKIEGVALPVAYEVHFTTSDNRPAIVQIGNADGVNVPDQLLDTGSPIIAYIYLHTGDADGETVKIITIPVSRRAAISNEQPTPEQQTAIEEAIEVLNSGIDTVQTIAEEIPQTIDTALAEAKASGEFDGPQGERGEKGDKGDTGSQGPAGERGPAGQDGEGVPAGGLTGQVLKKASDADFDTEWAAEAPDMSAHFPGTNFRVDTKNNNFGTAQYASADGYQNEASGDYSHAEGTSSHATGEGSHAENNSSATGLYSHSEGMSTGANAEGAHSEGINTTANGNGSHAEGFRTTAAGMHAHAEGGDTHADGKKAHAEGNGTSAIGDMSHAEGFNTVANSARQHVFGQHNVPDGDGSTPNARGQYVEIVGNGNYNFPSNARTLDWQGNEWLAGKVSVGTAASPTPVTNANDLTTKKYVDDAVAGIAVSVSGTTPTINALPGIRYVCGEVSTLDITLPASGCIDVTFTSGSTATVLTITPPTGVTVRWTGGFDPTSLDANTTYEINICDGLGVAGSWT